MSAAEGDPDTAKDAARDDLSYKDKLGAVRRKIRKALTTLYHLRLLRPVRWRGGALG